MDTYALPARPLALPKEASPAAPAGPVRGLDGGTGAR